MTLDILVADDHPAVLRFLSDYLEGQGFTVIGSAADGEEALEKIERQHPRIALLDIEMPKLGGIEIARRLALSTPQTTVVLYTGRAEPATLDEALGAGIRGIVEKDAPLADLKRAIETVAAGGTYIDSALRSAPDAQKTRELTVRQRDVLRLLAEGRSNEEIGVRLHISPETARTHLRKAMTKLGATTRTEAVARAIRESYI